MEFFYKFWQFVLSKFDNFQNFWQEWQLWQYVMMLLGNSSEQCSVIIQTIDSIELRTSIHHNHSDLAIKIDTGQHSQVLQYFSLSWPLWLSSPWDGMGIFGAEFLEVLDSSITFHHTWYLSPIPPVVSVEKNMSCGEFFWFYT